VNVLVTGANGFVGRAVVRRLAAEGHRVRAAIRGGPALDVESIRIGDIDGDTDWAPALDRIDAVVHLAARVHVVDARAPGRAAEALAAARRINRDGTARLAHSCGREIRFVLMSSIRAVVDESHPTAIDERTSPQPTTPYGISKLEGERELAAAAHERRFSWIALRPPLVIGEGVGGNVRRLMASIRRGLPLPLAAVHNRRSTIYVGNLADAVRRALEPDAPHAIALPLTDGPAHSTAALVHEIARAMMRPAPMLAVPPRWLELALRLVGHSPLWSRLCGDLEIDESTRDRLGWVPTVSFSEAVRRCVHAYLETG
jgi:nucleoside-diphosphate-sugar epimerase